MPTVQLSLPDELFAALRKSPGEVEREVRLAAAIDWYRRGLISQGRAAELAGLPRADFLDALAAMRIDVFEVDIADLQREVEPSRLSGASPGRGPAHRHPVAGC